MITTRRSFVKLLSAVAGSIPLPGVVKRLAVSLVPEEQTLEDAEDILRGLIARCLAAPLGADEAKLVGSFLRRMRPSDADYEKWNTARALSSEERELPVVDQAFTPEARKRPYSVRFIVAFTKGTRPKAWFEDNYRRVSPHVMGEVVEVFNHPAAKRSLDAKVKAAKLRGA